MCGGGRLFSLKCVLIEFNLPNLSLLCICLSAFKTSSINKLIQYVEISKKYTWYVGSFIQKRFDKEEHVCIAFLIKLLVLLLYVSRIRILIAWLLFGNPFRLYLCKLSIGMLIKMIIHLLHLI